MKARQHFTIGFLLVTFNMVAYPALAVTLAADDASQQAYADSWQSGDNGGSGFGPWALEYSGLVPGLFHAPQFIDRAPLSGNSLGAPSFALTTGDRDFFSDTSEAQRAFSAPLGIGQTFSMDIDGSALDPAATIFSSGNTIQLFGVDGQERFGLYTNNGFLGDHWIVNEDVSTGIPAATAFHMDFTLATADTYNLTLSPIGGDAPLFTRTGAALTGTAGAGINSLRISDYGTGSSLDGVSELFFNNFMVTAAGLNGDYNHNGAVDSADYVIWRKTLGFVGAGLPADGNGNGRIDSDDYNVWKADFGGTSGSAVRNLATTVAEPASGLIASVTVAGFLIASISRRRGGRLSIKKLRLSL
ncbi:MAG TPA: hypothetical protein VGK58_15975 [Lacipirellulaceae bacterium]